MARKGSSRRSTIAVVGAIAVVVFLLVIAAGSTSAACSACHDAQGSELKKTEHASIGCYTCHLESGTWSVPEYKANELLVMYPQQVIDPDQETLTETSRDACLACHAHVLKGITTAKGLRVKHSVCATGSTCDTCHATTAHRKASGRNAYSSMEDCVKCHSENDVPIECETCHQDKAQTETLRSNAWQVTHGSNWKKTHGMGDPQSCKACHPGTYCAKCHEVEIPHPTNWGTTHGTAALKDSESCEVCHEPATFCEPCHGMPMPHPAGFLQGHGDVATSVEDSRCSRCHAMTDCAECHDNHVHPGGTQPPPPPIGANR